MMNWTHASTRLTLGLPGTLACCGSLMFDGALGILGSLTCNGPLV